MSYSMYAQHIWRAQWQKTDGELARLAHNYHKSRHLFVRHFENVSKDSVSGGIKCRSPIEKNTCVINPIFVFYCGLIWFPHITTLFTISNICRILFIFHQPSCAYVCIFMNVCVCFRDAVCGSLWVVWHVCLAKEICQKYFTRENGNRFICDEWW